MAKTMKRVISLLLAVVLVVGTFAGCGKSNKNEPPITATAVKFSKSGQYTTTVSSKKVDLSGITAENVEVRYIDPTDAIVSTELGNTEAATEDTTEEAATEEATEATTEAAETVEDEKVNPEEVYTLTAKVEGVKAADKKSYEITFTDDKAADYITKNYVILFKGVEGDDNTAEVAVEFPEITLTPDIESVVSNAKETKVTLAIDGSTFEDGISEKDIYLDNAFSDMTIESMSSSDKNLTVQLKGSPIRNEAGAYQWGSVNVKPRGIKDGYTNVAAKVDIKLASAYIDTETLKYDNGKINADLKIYGVVDINTLTKDNIKIDGATVEAAEKTDDNTIKLTIMADGIKSVNDFADLVGGKAMTLGDYETQADISQASFYPVFDYVEEDGDNLKITLKLYANSGSFDKNLKSDAIGFADDFKEAKVDSVKVESDTLATLILSVPSNGQTAETMAMNGTVTLSAGSLTNAWGDKTAAEASYTRDYSGETLGREVTLNTDTLLEIQKFTRGQNTTFGQICYWGGVAGQVGSIAKTILEVTGVIKSEHAETMEKLEEINGKIDSVLENQLKIIDMLDKFGKEQKSFQNDDYKDKIDTLNNYVKIMEDQLKVGALYMALDEAVAAGKLDKVPNFSGLEGEALTATVKKYEQYIPDVSKMSEQEMYEYNDKLVDYILDQSDNSKVRRFASFKTNSDNLYDALLKVTDKLNRTDGTNPMQRYDELCSMMYNFDSQCYYFRASQRDTALALIARGLAIVTVVEKGFSDPLNPNFKRAKNAVTSAATLIDKEYINNLGYPAEMIQANPHVEVYDANTYISDIAVGGGEDSYVAQKALTDKGYTVYKRDLNEGAGGSFVYIGYKTTTDYNKAIKWVGLSTNVWSGPKKNWTSVPAYGNSSFVNSKGDLNHEAGGQYIYLYTSTQYMNQDTALTDFYIDGNESGSVNEIDMNKYAGGSDLFLHCRYGKKNSATGRKLETNPEFYPYSYVLGKKVAIGTNVELATQGVDPNVVTAALKTTDGSYRNWTESEMSEFAKRITYSTLEQEFASAGLKGGTNNLAMVASNFQKNKYSTEIYGKYMSLKSNKVESCEYPHDTPWGSISSDLSVHLWDFTYLMLYDYTLNGNAQQNGAYIKDVKLAQGSTSSATKNALTKDGYDVVGLDLDDGTGGDYIYLGVKTTDNYEEAIGNFYVYKGSDNAKEKTFDGLKYTLCGSVASNTHDIWLYYTKQKTDGAVSAIYFTSTNSFTGSGNIGHNNGTGDFNDGEGGNYIHMFVEKIK